MDIPLTPEDTPSEDWVLGQLRRRVAKEAFDGFHVLRVRFSGHTDKSELLSDSVAGLREWEDPAACVESVRLEVLPVVDTGHLRAAGPVPALIGSALKTVPPELRTRLEAVCRDVNHQPEFAGSGFPPVSPDDLPLASLLEQCLRHTLHPDPRK